MAIQYSDFKLLKIDYPLAAQLIEQENSIQFPKAKFIKAVVGYFNHFTDLLDLMVVFDNEITDCLLYIWICNVEEPYINKYIELAAQQAYFELTQLI